LAPVMIMAVPGGPEVGQIDVMLGETAFTVNAAAARVPPAVVTATSLAPVAALASMVKVAMI
jgi:hypothetical protein